MPPKFPAAKPSASYHKRYDLEEVELPLLDLDDDPFQDVSLLPDPDKEVQELVQRPQGPQRTQISSSANRPAKKRPEESRNLSDRPSSGKLNGVAASFEMRSRGARREELDVRNPDVGLPSSSSSLNSSFVLVDIPIEGGDTLPSFAIKYHVTVSELKRLNHIFHDQDFHGRQKLRVPIHRYGILAERFLSARERGDLGEEPVARSSSSILLDLDEASSPRLRPLPSDSWFADGGGNDANDEVTQTISLRSMLSSQSREAKLFLQNMDHDLSRLKQTALARRPLSPVEEDELIRRRGRVEPLDGLGCDGSDLGIPVKVLLCMMAILIVVLPGAFVIYKLYCMHHPGACPLSENVTSFSNVSAAHGH